MSSTYYYFNMISSEPHVGVTLRIMSQPIYDGRIFCVSNEEDAKRVVEEINSYLKDTIKKIDPKDLTDEDKSLRCSYTEIEISDEQKEQLGSSLEKLGVVLTADEAIATILSRPNTPRVPEE